MDTLGAGRRPRLRADYQPFPFDDHLVVLGEGRNLLVDDPAVAALAALLDGTRTFADAAALLGHRYPVRRLAAALRRLARLGLLADGATTAPAGHAAAWDARGVDPERADRWLAGGRVLLVDAGAPAVKRLADALAGYGPSVEVIDVDDADLRRRLDGTTGDLDGGLVTGGPVTGELVTGELVTGDPPGGPRDDLSGDGPHDGHPRDALNGDSPHGGDPHGGDPHGGVVIVAAGSMIDPRLARVNDACLATGRSWTLVRPAGNVLVLGPHLRPGDTGCWACLRQRWEANEQVESYLGGRHGTANRPRAARASLPALVGVLAGLLAVELPVLALRGVSERLTGQLVTVDTRDLTTQAHQLVRQPQCPACGDPAGLGDHGAPARPGGDLQSGAGADRVVLAPSPYPGRDGRTVSAATTYRRLARHVSPLLGVVTRLTPLDGNEHGVVFGFAAGHNFAQAGNPVTLRRNLRGQSGGKGRTELEARASAVGEAIERYCGVWRGDRRVTRASYADLGPDRAVHPRELLHFSGRQYAERDRRNPELAHFHRIPAPLADDLALDWTTGWSLTHHRSRAVPAAYCWYGHPDLAALDFCSADSNGSAAGNTLAEAVLQGFCELVERDSVALWWYHRSRMPGVDLASFDDPWLDAVRRLYRDRYRRELWLLDLTADLRIPAFAAVSRRAPRPGLPADTEDLLVGFGAHLDPAVAVTRAVTELNQFLPMVQDPATGEPRTGVADRDTLDWLRNVRVATDPWLAPADGPPTTARTHRSLSTGEVAADVAECVRVAAAAGLEVIVVDQSRPELELAVAKVIVPGLRHFWRRLGPGRLWDVPPGLGRWPLASGEETANPRGVFF